MERTGNAPLACCSGQTAAFPKAARALERTFGAGGQQIVFGTVTVSLDALRRNAAALVDFTAPSKPAFVVKSNAYGHGAVDVALAIEPYARYLCVYSAGEAFALRDGGITAPLLVLGPVPPDCLAEAHARRVAISLWDTGVYLRAIATASHARRDRFQVHLKINTGATRLGLDWWNATDAAEDIARVGEIEIAGIFSHLAAAEELDSPFTTAQSETFERVLRGLQPLFAAHELHPLRHIAASAAAMLWPSMRLDMTRIGIALYGLWPSPETRASMAESGIVLEPALAYTSSLAAIREVEAGTSIGYGCSYHTPCRTRIGVVPLGYADGIPRLLSNRGSFLVAGVRCPIVGRVCMNLTLIDLGGAPRAHRGDTVTLIGSDGGASVTADDWAGWAETINYEIVARLPGELQRIHVQAETRAGTAAL